MALGFIDGPNREEVRQSKNGIAEAGSDSEIGGVVFLSCREKMSQFLNEGVLYGGGVVGRLCDNIRALDIGIGVNRFFPCETEGMKIIVRA